MNEVLNDIFGHNEDFPVLFVTNDFPPRKGGIQTFVRQLCEDLPPERVVVYTSRHEDALDHDRDVPYPVIRDPTPVLLPSPRLSKRVKAVARQYGCRGAVYGSSVPLGLLAPALTEAGVQRHLALTHGHEVWWASLPGTRQVLRRVANHVDVLTYVSAYTGRRIAPSIRGTACDFVRLSPRADPAFSRASGGRGVRRLHGIPDDSLVVICVARLVRRKGQDRLVRIWRQVLKDYPGAHLLLVGGGPDHRRLTRMIKRRKLGSHVTLAGEVEETPPYYAAADVFAMPVRNRFFGLEVEGLGISYLEAAAAGLTVVPGRGGGAPEAK